MHVNAERRDSGELRGTGVDVTIKDLARMIEQDEGGSVVLVSSITAVSGGSANVSYTTAKAALLGLSRHIAVNYARYGIRCNAILPGATDTEMVRTTFLTSPEIEAEWINKTALKRLGTPEDQAKVAVFLASDLSSHITGEAIVVSAGEMMSQ